jgi:hypothetical protein
MLAAAALAASATVAVADGHENEGAFCMDVEIKPFHMIPGFMTEEGACAVRDYWDGWLQEKYYPFTLEDHLFNCEYFGDVAPLPTGDMVPSSVVSEGDIEGTIGGHPFTATLLCASLTNWYQDSCSDPDDPSSCTFQLAQPFFNLIDRDPYPRVTEVSVFDGVINVHKGNGKTADVPIIIATRAAGITHLESLDPPQVGASVTHSLLGMMTYEMDDDEIDDAEELEGSLDVLLQGHIFFPDIVENDPGAARIKGAICSKDLHNLLNRHRNRKGQEEDDDD